MRPARRETVDSGFASLPAPEVSAVVDVGELVQIFHGDARPEGCEGITRWSLDGQAGRVRELTVMVWPDGSRTVNQLWMRPSSMSDGERPASVTQCPLWVQAA